MKISKQQKQLLLHLCNDRKRSELPELMGIKFITIYVHMRDLKDNLGALTKEHAIAFAFREGLIE